MIKINLPVDAFLSNVRYTRCRKELINMTMTMGPYILVVFALIILNMYRERTVRPWKLLFFPILLLWGVSSSVQPGYFSSTQHIIISGILLIIGSGIGYAIGKMVTVRIDEESGNITSRGSLGSVILIIAVLLLRMSLRIWLPGDNEWFSTIVHSMLFVPLGTIAARNFMLFKEYSRLTKVKARIQ